MKNTLKILPFSAKKRSARLLIGFPKNRRKKQGVTFPPVVMVLPPQRKVPPRPQCSTAV
jgi:hypothetical protein